MYLLSVYDAPYASHSLEFSLMFQGVMELEKKLGGVFLDKTKTILFQDTSAPLMLTLEDIGPGWKIKPQSDSVEIPFHHIWNSTHNYLHCSFQLEKVDRATDNIQFRILASQKGSPTHRQIFRVTAELKTPASNSCQKVVLFAQVEPAGTYNSSSTINDFFFTALI